MESGEPIQLSSLVPEKTDVPTVLPDTSLVKEIVNAIATNSSSTTTAGPKRKSTRGIVNGKYVKKKTCPAAVRKVGGCDKNIHFYRTRNNFPTYTTRRGKMLK